MFFMPEEQWRRTQVQNPAGKPLLGTHCPGATAPQVMAGQPAVEPMPSTEEQIFPEAAPIDPTSVS